MTLFELVGYDTSQSYPLESKTSVGNFALVISGVQPPSTSSIYYGTTNITSIYYGNNPIVSAYYNSVKVF